jgi:hypothetical protein
MRLRRGRRHAARLQESQFARAIAQCRQGLGPQGSSLDVRALVVAQFFGPGKAQSPLVRDHRVVPRRQALGQRGGFGRPNAGSKEHIRIHVRNHPFSRDSARDESIAVEFAIVGDDPRVARAIGAGFNVWSR